MKPWMAAVVSGGAQLVTLPPITSNQTVVIPFGVSRIETISGFGARGTDGSFVQRYNKVSKIYAQRRGSGIIDTFTGTADTLFGPTPANYCDPVVLTPDDPIYENNQTCYEFFDASYTNPPLTGASATGFGLSFPGSTGNVAQTPTVYNNVAVTGGQSYNVVVPSGSSITISYYR